MKLMSIEEKILEGIFIKRLNKFLVEIKQGGKINLCHLRDTGRLVKLLYQSNKLLFIKKSLERHRKTNCEILAAWRTDSSEWVLINPGFHNDIVEKIISNRLIRSLKSYIVEAREIKYGSSRIDFLLRDKNGSRALLEVKGCTLFGNNTCYYPDAPTKRGSKHLVELSNAVKNNMNAFILFIVPGKAERVKPNEEIDPIFSRNFRKAIEIGVKPLAVRVKLINNDIYFVNEIPVIIDLK